MDINRERLLVELLALNFHETLSLKPLMVDVDRRLVEKLKLEMDHDQGRHVEQTEKAWGFLESLRSSAKIVANSGSLALLTKKTENSDLQQQSKDQTCIYRIDLSMPDKGKMGSLDAKKEKSSPPLKSPPCFSTISRFFSTDWRGDLIEVQSPDNRYTLLFQIRAEWKDQNFRVLGMIDSKRDTKEYRAETSGNQNNAPHVAAVTTVEFLLTWFDFPLTENSLPYTFTTHFEINT